MKHELTNYFFVFAVVLTLCLSGCKDDDPLEQLSNLNEIDDHGSTNSLTELSEIVQLGSRDVGKNVVFQDITDQAGVNFTYRNGHESGNTAILESLGGGVGMLDYDMNGTVDLFFPGGGKYQKQVITGHPGMLYSNNGSAKFTEITTAAFTNDASLYTHGCQVADFDNDGFSDFILTGWNSLKLFHNQGDGTFMEIHEPAGLDNKSWSSSAAWGDYNGDGNLDLYV
jgi:hypothetical protein